jgi:hypothetical protein
MDIQTFAHKLGLQQRQTREATLPYHLAYKPATPEQQKDLRRRWMLGHIMGSLEVDEVKADRILSQSRDDRKAEHQAAYRKASSDFEYHVIRPVKKPAGGSTGAAKTDVVAEALALVESMTPAQKKRFLAAL